VAASTEDRGLIDTRVETLFGISKSEFFDINIVNPQSSM